MRLVTFQEKGQDRIGALASREGREMLVDLNRADPGLPRDMVSFLEGGEASRERAERVLASSNLEWRGLGGLKLRAPIPRPGKIVCVGLNYRDHAKEVNLPLPEVPTLFSKYSNGVIGPGEPIRIPPVTKQVDYEGELVVVIGKRARRVAERDALEYVAGYTAMNDVSARDLQFQTSQWTAGKALDTFAPMGPVLLTRDEVADPHSLKLRVSVGKEVLQDSNTGQMIFRIPELIAFISGIMTLEPGDVIATGTPAGVGFTRKPPRFLKAGETVRVEIEGLGALVNPVVRES